MYKIKVKINIKKDAWNWWHACNKVSYGVDWKQRISPKLRNKITGRSKKEAYKFLIPYLNKQYRRINIAEKLRKAQKVFAKPERLFEIMKKITGRKIYRRDFTCFLTTFPRGPYNKDEGWIWQVVNWGEKSYLGTFVHELLHFQTYHYWYKKCLKKLKNYEDFENLKEALTVVLNSGYKGVILDKDKGYRVHYYLRRELEKYWRKNKNFDKLVNYGVKIYPAFKDTIKYLKSGKYCDNLPKTFLKKFKAIFPKDLSQFGEKDVLKIIKQIRREFDSRKHKIKKTRDFKKSRFTAASKVLTKRQRSCGSICTLAASLFRSYSIPVKLINGLYVKNEPQMRHAWLEIYLPQRKKFYPFDVARRNLRLTRYHIKKGEYGDWSEL